MAFSLGVALWNTDTTGLSTQLEPVLHENRLPTQEINLFCAASRLIASCVSRALGQLVPNSEIKGGNSQLVTGKLTAYIGDPKSKSAKDLGNSQLVTGKLTAYIGDPKSKSAKDLAICHRKLVLLFGG